MEHPLNGLVKGLKKSIKEVVDSPALNTYFDQQNKAAKTIFNAVDAVVNLPERAMITVFESETLELEKGDHIYVQKSLEYTHHGLYVGNNIVIHYTKDDNEKSIIRMDSLDTFRENTRVFKRSKNASPSEYSPDEIVSRAYQRMGEERYNLVFNNCEHFVRWCRAGDYNEKVREKTKIMPHR